MARRKATRNTYTLSKLTWWGRRAWASKLIWNTKEILAYYYIAQNWNQCSENSAESNRPGAAKRCLRDSVLTQKVLRNLLFINKHGDNNTIGLLKGKHNFQHLFWGSCPTSVATLERHGTFYHTHNAQAFIWQFVLFLKVALYLYQHFSQTCTCISKLVLEILPATLPWKLHKNK